MPIFTTFVMGSKESYFFNTPTHWAWHNLPPDIEALFTATPPITDVIELALAPNSTYFITYRDATNTIHSKHYNLPNPLTDHLYASHPHIVRDLATLSITLGPWDAYFAWDKTAASWSNLPPALEKAVLARMLGEGRWKDDGAQAPCFALHLFPSHPNAYILILTTGSTFSNLPECTWADYNKIAAALPSQFTQTRLPIPPMPQYTSTPKAQTHGETAQIQRYNCCPQGVVPGVIHNCCPQVPYGTAMDTSMYVPMPSTMQAQQQQQHARGW
ncbi:hypothetical protein BDW02DRAFT_642408 [Decorospora gaudefroyi]|uniref:Uncharacterized protein n=1 Tax=Decorospora gaudefroyi TaxID=184978 RepID=A0A6A5K099_9PLEO|nr:hypothetical protein BDW02DRAFT_642408 [Decorospora gaudefroyi]